MPHHDDPALARVRTGTELRGASVPDHNPGGLSRTIPGFGRRLVWSGGQWLDGDLRAGAGAQPLAGALPGRGDGAPGAGGADGGDVGHFGGRGADGRPRFDQRVASGGYLWWYVDAISDDRRHGITLIAFVGSVFSPYYAWARRKPDADPMNHCALNVALYGNTARWAMTERSAAVCARNAVSFVIGPSRLRSSEGRLHVAIDEVANPLPRRVRGEVTIALGDCSTAVFALTPDGAHRWGPINPRARIAVALDCPPLRWEGWAYLDSNEGDEAIDQGFSDWDWSRAHLPDGSTAVLYEVRARPARLEAGDSPRRGTSTARSYPSGGDRMHPNPVNGGLLALQCFAGAEARRIEPGVRQSLGHSKWRIAMHSYQEGSEPARIRRRLEDTPFYARSLLDCRVLGHRVEAVHETLDARRFAQWWVQNLLPWRMPRAD